MSHTSAVVIYAAVGFAAALVYPFLIRAWHLRWGATSDEARRALPGDALVSRPWLDATRAITIRATPDQVWPWIIQMGYRRAGFYSYDWIDNDAIPSADRIIPELQMLKVGDVLPTGRDAGFKVIEMKPERLLVLFIEAERVRISSTIVLVPMDKSQTRMIFRVRARFSARHVPYFLVFDPGDFVMMRKLMLGIRARSEGAARGL